MRIIGPAVLASSVAVLLLSCSDPSAPPTPSSVTVVEGNAQRGTVMAALPQPVVVEVLDVDGQPARGISVTWTVTNGGGTVSTPATVTDREGRAQVSWTLGSAAGQNRLRAGVDGVAPAVITAEATAAAPASLSIVSGDQQVGVEHLALGDPLVIAVHDAYGNPVFNAPVTFSPGSGIAIPPINTTDPYGEAQARWTPVEAGDQSLIAAANGVAAEVRFDAVVLPADALLDLANDTAVGGMSAPAGNTRFFRFTVPANTAQLTVSTTGGPGDADLFVRHARLPTPSMNDCQSTSPTAAEECTLVLPDAGVWYVRVDAFTGYSSLSLRARWVVGGSMTLGISGLPQGVEGDVLITGPARYERRVTTTTTLTGLRPGNYEVSTSFVTDGGTVYVSTPHSRDVEVSWGSETPVSVVYAANDGALNLDIPRAYITQGVQRLDGSVPLVAGRDGVLRVFARGNVVRAVEPTVRARIYHDGTLAETFVIAAPAPTPPISHDEGSLESSWNVALPGSLIRQGMSILIDVDPDNAVDESDETDNTFPQSGVPLAPDVRAAAVLQARLIPIVQSNGMQGDVTAGNADTYVTDAQALYPLPGIDVDVRAPYSFSGVLPASYDSTWGRLLGEVNALRVAESSQRYYYGVIKPAYSQGGTGLGYIGQRASIGVDKTDQRALTVAHEWGHNFGRLHVDCGGPSGIDVNYPYAGGRMGHHGYDMRTHRIVDVTSHYDLMSYCRPTWSSDYTYGAVLFFRGVQAGQISSASGAPERSLLVWGRISPEGALLEPAFEITAAAAMPDVPGPYRLTGTNAQGETTLDMSFAAYEIDHLPGERLFAFVVPLRLMDGSAPAEIRLHGAGAGDVVRRQSITATADVQAVRDGSGVRLMWDAVRTPALIVRDARTNEILSFARGGDVRITTTAAEVDIDMSDGVRSARRTVPVRR